jgi:hypothetical protein
MIFGFGFEKRHYFFAEFDGEGHLPEASKRASERATRRNAEYCTYMQAREETATEAVNNEEGDDEEGKSQGKKKKKKKSKELLFRDKVYMLTTIHVHPEYYTHHDGSIASTILLLLCVCLCVCVGSAVLISAALTPWLFGKSGTVVALVAVVAAAVTVPRCWDGGVCGMS